MNPIQCNEVVMRDGFHIEPDFAPTAAKAVMGRIRRVPGVEYTVLVPDVRGMGLANVLASVQEGITRFDGSLGGLGGCPYAPGATGNICSEDAIHMLHAMGYDTGIDLPRLLSAARRLPDIVAHDVPGQVAKAGLITDLHPAPPYVAELRSAQP